MLDFINHILWGYIVSGALILTGVRLSVKTRFFQIRRFGEMLKSGAHMFRKSDRGTSPFEAMSAALSGTMGTGNIIGVGAAIALGGAGALFWMIISSFLCMIIKFAEVALSLEYRTLKNGEKTGGAMYYITRGIGEKYRPLSVIFSIATILASFGIGAAAQSSAAAGAVSPQNPALCVLSGLLLAVAAACVIFGTAKKITKFTSYLVPLMTLTYFIGAAIALIKFRARILPSIALIRNSAFSPIAAGGGIVGMLTCAAVRHGFSKGMFTNEAGMGSAPIIHATADNTPRGQGLIGMLEVFLDTAVMCTLTGLVILTAGCENLPGSMMTSAAFCRVFGSFGSVFISLCVTLFAFGAAVGWCCYGAACCSYLFRHKAAVVIYKILYCAVIFGGACLPVSLVLEISDILNAFMAAPNLFAINVLSRKVREIADRKE